MNVWTDAPPFDWVTFGILTAGIVLITIGFAVWLALQPDEPPDTTRRYREKLAQRDREEAELNRRRLDADAGRVDHVSQDLT